MIVIATALKTVRDSDLLIFFSVLLKQKDFKHIKYEMERPLIVREQLIYPLVSFVFGGLFFRGGGRRGGHMGNQLTLIPPCPVVL